MHKLHAFSGTSHALEGKAALGPENAGRVQARAKVASFDSGNSNRDEHMREVTHAAAHPTVELKGSFVNPLTLPATVEASAVIELNGVG